MLGGGIQIGPGPSGPIPGWPSVHPYGGVQDRNISITYAPTGSVSPGLNLGAGGTFLTPITSTIFLPVAVQVGNSPGGIFWEVGLGLPLGFPGFGAWWVW